MSTIRRRLIAVLNDGKTAFRVAKADLSAQATVWVYPDAKDSLQSHTDMSAVQLQVHPDGSWEVATRPAWVDGQARPEWTTAAVGRA